LREFGWRE